MMKYWKRIIVSVLTVCFLLTACSTQPTKPSQSATASAEMQSSSENWIVSELSGSVTADMKISPKDDFHAAINQDWLATVQIGDSEASVNSFTERGEEVKKQVMTLILDKSQTSHEAELVQTLYNTHTDMETRNALGVEPVMPYLKSIQEINSLSDLTAYYTSDQEKMASLPCGITPRADYKDSKHNAVYIEPTELSLVDADEYRTLSASGKKTKQAMDTFFPKMLEKVGYSKKDATKINDQLFALEGKIAEACKGSQARRQPDSAQASYNPISLQELKTTSAVFPITEFLKKYTDVGVDRFISVEPAWLSKMNELYVEENVEGFKAILLYNTLSASMSLLDQESVDLTKEYSNSIVGKEMVQTPEDAAYELINNHLGMAVGKMYAEEYVTPQTKQDVEEIIAHVVEVYRNRLSNIDWLSDQTKAKTIEKLDALKVRVAYPDDWSNYDYSSLQFAKGDNLLEAVVAINKYSMDESVATVTAEIDSNKWFMPPQTINASYYSSDNSINIPAGILGGAFYDPNGSEAAQLGGIGLVIGHEITHGFDSTGSQYDKDGNLNNWWTDEDRAAFAERTSKVSKYYSQFEVLPDVYLNGDLTIGETVADLGGMACMLEIAKGIEGFDYKAFYASYANVGKCQALQNVLERILQTDVHPPGYLRTNTVVQQSQEFYDAMGIQPEDGMYLAPDERVSVW